MREIEKHGALLLFPLFIYFALQRLLTTFYMLLSTPRASNTCDSAMPVSPKYSRRHCASPTSAYDSPMLPPSSPLARQRPLFPLNLNALDDSFKSPAPLNHTYNPFYSSKPLPIEDEEGSIFLSSAPSGSFSPFFSPSSSQPLLTPVKKIHHVNSRAAFASSSNPVFGEASSVDNQPRAGTAGKKRKSTPHATPLRTNNLTPLKITTQSKRSDNSMAFECLAPLPAPKFNQRTPQSKAETEAYLKRQTATLTRLRLTDHSATAAANTANNDETEFDGTATDSGCEMDEDDPSDSLFLGKSASTQLPKTLVFHPAVNKGKEKAVEVIEAVSPGGHINKRRARSRPVSSELREQTFKVPKSPIRVCFTSFFVFQFSDPNICTP